MNSAIKPTVNGLRHFVAFVCYTPAYCRTLTPRGGVIRFNCPISACADEQCTAFSRKLGLQAIGIHP